MTREEIIAMAREAGVIATKIDGIERFAELVAKHEREQCLTIADQCADADMNAAMAANAIRARSKK